MNIISCSVVLVKIEIGEAAVTFRKEGSVSRSPSTPVSVL